MDRNTKVSQKFNYKEIVEEQNETICRFLPDGTITYVNEAYCNFYKKKPKELIGSNYFEHVPVSEMYKDLEFINYLEKYGTIELAEEKVIVGGKIRWVQWSGKVIKDEEGKYKEFQTVGRDITRRKKIEEEVYRQKQKAEQYLNLAGNIILALSNEGKITLINKKGLEILGFDTAEEVLGKDWFKEFVDLEYVAETKNIFSNLLSGNNSKEYEVTLIKDKNGNKRIIAWYNTLIKDNDGKIIGTLSSGDDITERKKYEKEREDLLQELQIVSEHYQEEAGRLDAIFSSLADPVLVYSKDGVVVKANNKTLEVFGFDPIDMNVSELLVRLSKKDSSGAKIRLEKTLVVRALKGETVRGEKFIIYGSGNKKMTCLGSGSPIMVKKKIIGAVVIFYDIDKLEKIQKYLKKSKDYLEKQVTERTNDLLKVNIDLRKEIIERKKTEKKILENNELLEKIFASTNFMLAYMDTYFNFIQVNQAYAAADNNTPEYYVGKNHFQLFPNTKNEEIFKKVIKTGKPYMVNKEPFVYENNPERGVTYWDWIVLPIKNNAGSVSGILLSLVDRTEDVHSEEKVLELYKHLGVINRQISILLNLGKNRNGKRKDKMSKFIINSAKNLSKADFVALYRFFPQKGGKFSLTGVDVTNKNKAKKINLLDLKDYMMLKPMLIGNKVFGENLVTALNNNGLKFGFYISLPLLINRKLKGMFLLGFSKRNDFNTQELEFYEAFAAQSVWPLKDVKII